MTRPLSVNQSPAAPTIVPLHAVAPHPSEQGALPQMRSWTLITVTYNSADTLRRFWSDVDLPAAVEWLVVDNASTDDSVEVARSLGATVLASEVNLGFGRANNRALREAKGRYVAFVNPDVTIDTVDLDRLAAEIDTHGGLIAPQLLNPDGSMQPNGRGAPMLMHKVANRISKPLGERLRYHLLAERDEVRPICWAIGAAISGRTEDLRRMGGWDERFFIYYEDKDICLRAWSGGLPVHLVGSVRWTHGWARETTAFRLQPWLHEVRSARTFYFLYPEFLLGPSLRAGRWRRVRRALAGGASRPVALLT